MLIAVTGLHKAGKTTLTNIIKSQFDFKVIRKIDILREVYSQENSYMNIDTWQKYHYKKNTYEFTKKLFKDRFDEKENVVLDAIYNPNELYALKDLYPSVILASVITPRSVIITRGQADIEHDDIYRANCSRQFFFHVDNSNHPSHNCLLAEADWSFNGVDTEENIKQSFRNLMNFFGSKKILYNKIHLDVSKGRERND